MTLFAAFFRPIEIAFSRERLITPDQDFIDIDCYKTAQRKAAVLLHGLEGSSNSSYIRGMAKALGELGFDIYALNFRGCSGEPNLKLDSYHSGETRDLRFLLKTLEGRGHYDAFVLVGFSLGGNVLLKFLGEEGSEISPRVKAAVAFSVPCDLKASAEKLAQPINRLYMRKFLQDLTQRMREKKKLFPLQVSIGNINKIKTFRDFDERYTAPIHGFSGAEDYWWRNSSTQFIPRITVLTLIVNSLDDPFLANSCYPYEEARRSTKVFLETPRHGGHNAFVEFSKSGFYWSEQRAIKFFEEI